MWYYNGNEFVLTKDLENHEGFVYIITNLTNDKKYIGKKSFWSRRTQSNGRRKTLESDWKKYYGSSEKLKNDVALLGKESFSREILYICECKKSLSYWETYEQFVRGVIETAEYYNDNVMGRFFKSEYGVIFERIEKHPSCAKDDTWRLNHSERMKGIGNPRFGKTLTDDARAKISAANKGKVISDEHRKALSVASSRRIKTPEERKKISESQKGTKNHRFGKKNSETQTTKIIESRIKRITDGHTVWVGVKKYIQDNNITFYRFKKLLGEGRLWYLDAGNP